MIQGEGNEAPIIMSKTGKLMAFSETSSRFQALNGRLKQPRCRRFACGAVGGKERRITAKVRNFVAGMGPFKAEKKPFQTKRGHMPIF
ncbi:MAG: hypothetical protein LBB55_02160 [Zoogloeaceae bacterium]|jgi:hypothetical protein|nr:hypothetical protein [Zoogloeaceae bacterium]